MCTITNHLEMRPAKRAAYDQLAHFHYRGHCPAVYTAKCLPIIKIEQSV